MEIIKQVLMREDPDRINAIGAYWDSFQTRAFMYIDGQLKVSAPNKIHGNIAQSYNDANPDNPLSVDKNKTFRSGPRTKYAGRIWLNTKAISFWQYPKTHEELIQTITDLEEFLNIDILGDNKWIIETARGKVYPLHAYLKKKEPITQRSSAELGKKHMQSPMLKGKDEVPQGLGSKKRPADLPRSQYYKTAGMTSDGIIKESPDFVEDEENKNRLSWVAPDAIAFMYVKGKLETSNRSETHGDIADTLNINLPMNRKSEDIEYSGRLWVGSKYLSFWEYPRDIRGLVEIVHDLEAELNILIFDKNWKLELAEGGTREDEDDDVGTGEIVNLDDYIKSSKQIQQRSSDEMGKKHMQSPMLKGRETVPQGMGSMKRPADLPRFQYNKLKGRTSDSMIKLGNLLEDADVNKIAVAPISRNESKEFIEKHYLGKFPATPTDYIGIFYDGSLVGVIIYGSPSAPGIVASVVRPLSDEEAQRAGKQSGEYPIIMQQIKELQRMYIMELPENIRKNMATMSIVRANRLMESKYQDLRIIVSYSDPTHHEGTIYKASNAIFMGRGVTGRVFKYDNSDRITRVNRVPPEDRDKGKVIQISGKDKYVWLAGDKRNKKFIQQFLKVQ